MVDRDLVLRKLADLETYLGQLALYRDVDLDVYSGDWKTQRIVERTLHLAIETCMDVADHIVADRRLRVPDTGGATFEILAEAGLLSPDLGTSMARMVGFRNILVHDYARIDAEIVLTILKSDLFDLVRFREAILSAI